MYHANGQHLEHRVVEVGGIKLVYIDIASIREYGYRYPYSSIQRYKYGWATLSQNPVSRELNVDSSREPRIVYSINTVNTPQRGPSYLT